METAGSNPDCIFNNNSLCHDCGHHLFLHSSLGCMKKYGITHFCQCSHTEDRPPYDAMLNIKKYENG